jgi:hypothetical protein
MKIEILMSSLKKKHEASLIAFISIGMIAAGFALTAVAPPLLYIFESGGFSVRLSFLKASLDRHINIAIMGIFLLVAGLTVFIQIVDDGFMEGLSKLTDLIPELKTGTIHGKLWSRSYFVATVGNVTADIVKKYVEEQWEKEK